MSLQTPIMDNTQFQNLIEKKTRDELLALSRLKRAQAEAYRTLAKIYERDEKEADANRTLAQSDEAGWLADELEAAARNAAPIRAQRDGKVREIAIYVWQGDAEFGSRWQVAVQSRQGTHHFNDFKTREEALLYIAHVRLNWPDLPAIEIVG